MKIEALNCPNCGAAVSSDRTLCQFCNSRLKTQACPECLGLMFIGSKHCSHCGAKTVTPDTGAADAGDCPRCKTRLTALEVEEVTVQECTSCGGLWSASDTFESICQNSEKQSVVLNFTARRIEYMATPSKISYVPCPRCKQLMNRSNFARASGVIIDLCKPHGVWFDADELPKIIEFIRKGGIEMARQRERLELKEERERLESDKRTVSMEMNRSALTGSVDDEPRFGGIIDFLFKI
ncbi:MAG: zf-TFIIB domain-containing protein [Pyrinomonadaceae bacterium]